jgi:hypothetical protein
MVLREDPAERGYLRFFYRDWRPTRLGRIWSRAYAWVVGLGLLSGGLVALLVQDRKTGRLHSHVLVAATYEGRRYLVSMLGGRSTWVQDVWAANGAAFLKAGHIRPVVLTEIPPHERAPIIKAWCQAATSGRRHLSIPFDAPVSAFETITADYPVFRVDPVR